MIFDLTAIPCLSCWREHEEGKEKGRGRERRAGEYGFR